VVVWAVKSVLTFMATAIEVKVVVSRVPKPEDLTVLKGRCCLYAKLLVGVGQYTESLEIALHLCENEENSDLVQYEACLIAVICALELGEEELAEKLREKAEKIDLLKDIGSSVLSMLNT